MGNEEEAFTQLVEMYARAGHACAQLEQPWPKASPVAEQAIDRAMEQQDGPGLQEAISAYLSVFLEQTAPAAHTEEGGRP